MQIDHMRLLAAGVSILSVGVALDVRAHAAQVEGVRQEATGATAVNFYEVATGDPAADFGAVDEVVNPGGPAAAVASVLCAELTTCAAAGAIEQFASAADQAENGIAIDGVQAVQAVAAAEGATATAIAFIDTAISQRAVSGGGALDWIAIAGSLDLAASAEALASAGDAVAIAGIGQAILMEAIGATNAAVDFSNSGTIDIAAHAQAEALGTATTDTAFAHAGLSGVNALAAATVAAAAVTLGNDGTLAIAADAQAAAPGQAQAEATAAYGMVGRAIAADGASVVLANHGALSVLAEADAIGSGAAAAAAAGGMVATATGTGPGDASVDVVNSSSVLVSADAHAATVAGGTAQANASATAVLEAARGLDVSLSVDNSGTFEVGAVAEATGDLAFAYGGAGGLLQQGVFASETATLEIVNSGEVDLAASAVVLGDTAATGIAFAIGASQSASALGAIVAGLENSGDIAVSADVEVDGGTFALGTAFGIGAQQSVIASTVDLDIENSGSLSVGVNVDAAADTSAGFAYASVRAFGLRQAASGVDVDQSLANSGTLQVDASALASAPAGTADDGRAIAFAFAVGARQTNVATVTVEQSFTNSGTIEVHAVASAPAVAASATAAAAGYQPFAGGLALQSLAIDNSGSIDVTASAIAAGRAYSLARGIYVNNAPTPEFQGSPVTGSITNSGDIGVLAYGSGQTTSTVVGTGTTATTVTFGGSSVFATGILVFGGVNTMEITNSGSIRVDAVAANGRTAIAMGIVALANAETTAAAGDVLTISNAGDIITRQSVDDGATWQRGLAINVAGNPDNNVLALPNRTVINLLGGSIYGNIALRAAGDDIINVQDDETALDGIINPLCMPETLTAGDQPALGACGVGTLNINSGGTLFLQDPRLTGDPAMYDGPGYVFVDTLDMRAPADGTTGTIAVGLEPQSGGDQAPGTYAQIFADTAYLDGTLEARLAVPGGLFADSYFWDNVIDAGSLAGSFDSCSPGGPFDVTPLLEFACAADSGANIDLSLERVAFDALAGLTANQRAVAGGIENVYSTSLTGPFADLVAELFLLDEAELVGAYDQLGGIAYADYLHAARNSSFAINSLVSDQLDCAVRGRGPDACRTPEEGGRIWVASQYNMGKYGDSGPGGYDSSNWSAQLGGEYRMGNFSIGGFAGYRDLKLDFPDAQDANRIKGSGWQLGVTAAYDVGTFYLRGIGSYASLDGDARSQIAIGSLAGTSAGDPDLDIWSLHGEAGTRFDLGGSWLTPFVVVDHTSLKLKSFTETGVPGAGLDLDGQTESQTSGLLGLKWAGNFGALVPEATIAYRHDFQDELVVDARFADAPAGSDFVTRREQDRSSIVAGARLDGALGSNVNGSLGYQGRFGDEVEDHAISGALTLQF